MKAKKKAPTNAPCKGDRLVGYGWRGEIIAVVARAIRNKGVAASTGVLVRMWDKGGDVWLTSLEWSPSGMRWGFSPGGVAYRMGEEPDYVGDAWRRAP